MTRNDKKKLVNIFWHLSFNFCNFKYRASWEDKPRTIFPDFSPALSTTGIFNGTLRIQSKQYFQKS